VILLYELNLLKSDHHLIYGSSMNISDNRSRLMNQQSKRRADHVSVLRDLPYHFAEYRSNLIKLNAEKISKFKINYLKMNQMYEQGNTSRNISFLDSRCTDFFTKQLDQVNVNQNPSPSSNQVATQV